MSKHILVGARRGRAGGIRGGGDSPGRRAAPRRPVGRGGDTAGGTGPVLMTEDNQRAADRLRHALGSPSEHMHAGVLPGE